MQASIDVIAETTHVVGDQSIVDASSHRLLLDEALCDHVGVAELKRAPIGAVRRVYADLGLALSDDAERAMRRWLETRQVRHGGHRWSLGDFGLSADEVHARPVFREYCGEFGVEGCGGG